MLLFQRTTERSWENIFTLLKDLKQLRNIKVTVVAMTIERLRIVQKSVAKRLKKNGKCEAESKLPDDSIIKINKNTAESNGILRRLTVV